MLTTIAPICAIVVLISLIGHGVNEMGVTNMTPLIFVFWIFTALPLAAPYFAAKYLEYNVPIMILLVSTIIYGILYALTWFRALFLDGNCFLFGVWPFVIILPALAIAMLLDLYYVRKNAPVPLDNC